MSPHDPILVNSSGGFPIELILLLFVLLGLVILSFWLASVFAKRNRERDSKPVRGGATTDAPFLSVQPSANGSWEIRVRGHLYPTLEAVPDETTRREVLAGLKALASFSRAYLKKPAPAATQAATHGSKAPAPPSAEPEPPPLTVTQEANVTPLEAMKALRALQEQSRRRAKENPAPPPTLASPQFMPRIDLAREIEKFVEVLQAQTPTMQGREIKLRNGPGGGVIFVVEGKIYQHVDDIPDAAVQALIRKATQEWERKR